MPQQIFRSDAQVSLITRGPGAISLLTWGSNTPTTPSIVGAIKTSETGLTRWIVSFSHNFNDYAFKWDGPGEAVYQIGNGLERKPVGRSWSAATTLHWGATSLVSEDVSTRVTSAVTSDGITTLWIVPDTL
jgi:hypothetical protein